MSSRSTASMAVALLLSLSSSPPAADAWMSPAAPQQHRQRLTVPFALFVESNEVEQVPAAGVEAEAEAEAEASSSSEEPVVVVAANGAEDDEAESPEENAQVANKPKDNGFSAFVGNVDFNTEAEQLRAVFEEHGKVVNIILPKHKPTGRSRGFAFVEMETEQDLDNVIEKVDGIELDGRDLRVTKSVPREQQPERAPRPRQQKMYVGNLSFDTTEEHLKEFFGEFGQVIDSYMPMNLDGTPRGYAFVTMNPEDAENAIQETNGYTFMGRTLNVSKPLAPGEKAKRRQAATSRAKLYVGNLSFQTIPDTLIELFEEFGQVYDCYIPEDPITGNSRGFGFVTMDRESALMAVDEMNGCELDGRMIRVNEALPRGMRPPSDDEDGDFDDAEF